jgi:hypothetical protein
VSAGHLAEAPIPGEHARAPISREGRDTAIMEIVSSEGTHFGTRER